jgi:hypothetical protein
MCLGKKAGNGGRVEAWVAIHTWILATMQTGDFECYLPYLISFQTSVKGHYHVNGCFFLFWYEYSRGRTVFYSFIMYYSGTLLKKVFQVSLLEKVFQVSLLEKVFQVSLLEKVFQVSLLEKVLQVFILEEVFQVSLLEIGFQVSVRDKVSKVSLLEKVFRVSY